MSAPYPWIKDSGTISGAPTGRLAITSTSGLYLSTSTNSSILGPTNTDLSIESAGTGDIILKTNSNNILTINDSGDITSSKNLIVNNSSVGGSTNPSLTLNLTNLSGTTIAQEVYNQRTAATGTIYDCFLYAKDSNGNKIQYANINVSTPSITLASSRAAMTFGIRDSISTNTTYLQLDGQNTRVFIPRQLVMQNNIIMNATNIQNCSEITTPLGNTYIPQIVQYLTGNGTFTASGENNMRQVLVSTVAGTASWINSGINLPSNEDPTASAIFAGAWWVGTAQGNLYYTYDSGSNWNQWTSASLLYGPVYVLYPFMGGNYLAVGGSFSWPYNNAFYLDTGLTQYDFTNGSGGFNGPVFTFCENGTMTMLHIGGGFEYTSNFSVNCPYWWNWDYTSSSGYPWDNNPSTGFSGGDIRIITLDTNSGFFIVGGNFTDFIGTGIQRLVSFQLSGGSPGSYFSFGFIPDQTVYSIVPNSGGVLVGGYFTNSAGVSSCTTKYGFYANWNGSNWDLGDYIFSFDLAPIRRIIFIPTTGIYYTILQQGGVDILYQDGSLLPSLPVGSLWQDIFYNGSITTFSTDAQSSVGFPFYILNIVTSIIVDLSSVGAIVVYNGGQFSNNITLIGQGSTCQTIFNLSNNRWYVLSIKGTVQFN